MPIAKVVFPYGWSNEYDYECESSVRVGDVVQVPLKNKLALGLVCEIVDKTDLKSVLQVKKVLYVVDQRFVHFLQTCAKYYHKPVGYFANLALKDLKHLPTYLAQDDQIYTIEDLNVESSFQAWSSKWKKNILQEVHFKGCVKDNVSFLDEQQREVVLQIESALSANEHNIFLLDGATGSGKTQVYLEAIKELSKQKQVLILLPEILLTNAFAKRFEEIYGIRPLMWHCKVSKTAKDSIYAWAVNSESTGVLVGARSALFVPFANLGAVIIDEEHDGSYKQEAGYHAKQCARFLCQHFNCGLLSVSATPSFDYFVHKPKHRFSIHRQVKHGLAKVHLVDMKGEQGMFAKPVIHALEANLRKKELSLLFLNRKGFAPIVFCSACDERLVCKNCSVGMVFYKTGYVVCHYCSYHFKLPEKCSCGGAWKMFGLGIEKVAQIVQKMLPNANVQLAYGQMNKNKMSDLQKQLANNKVDVIIGTQIMAQGHHIKELSLVVMLDADFSLTQPTYKAFEQTYQLINQLRGRCGREDIPGKFMLQTHFPHNALLKAIKTDTQEQWIQNEIESRKHFYWPPFCKLCAIIVSSSDKEKAKNLAKRISDALKSKAQMEVLGPVPAPVHKLENLYRYRILIKYQDHNDLLKMLSMPTERNVKVVLDIDPENFM